MLGAQACGVPSGAERGPRPSISAGVAIPAGVLILPAVSAKREPVDTKQLACFARFADKMSALPGET
jgi:hypothetical protein